MSSSTSAPVNATIARLSFQALFGRRRGLVLMLIPALLIALAVLIRVLTEQGVGYELVDAVGFTLALPIVALLAASAVLGPEIDDGSIVYLIAKPVRRHTVTLSKYVVGWLSTLVFGALPLFVAGLVIDSSDPERALGWLVGGAVAGTTYAALFLGLAALTRHAVVIGLLFVLLWEGLLGNVFSGIRWFAIGAWGRETAGAVSSAVSDAGTGLTYALVASALVTAVSVWFAGDRLRSFTLRGDE
jgi:ABC-2 type transport system permease protein